MKKQTTKALQYYFEVHTEEAQKETRRTGCSAMQMQRKNPANRRSKGGEGK